MWRHLFSTSNIEPDTELDESPAPAQPRLRARGQEGDAAVLSRAPPHVGLEPPGHAVAEVDLCDKGSTPGSRSGDLQWSGYGTIDIIIYSSHHDMIVGDGPLTVHAGEGCQELILACLL